MKTSLFVYGTLMYPDLYREITGVPLQGETAILPNFSARKLKDRPYPGLISRMGGRTSGLLIRNVSTNSLKKLQQYEGKEYQLISVNVVINGKKIPAKTYALRKEYYPIVLERAWGPDWGQL